MEITDRIARICIHKNIMALFLPFYGYNVVNNYHVIEFDIQSYNFILPFTTIL